MNWAHECFCYVPQIKKRNLGTFWKCACNSFVWIVCVCVRANLCVYKREFKRCVCVIAYWVRVWLYLRTLVRDTCLHEHMHTHLLYLAYGSHPCARVCYTRAHTTAYGMLLCTCACMNACWMHTCSGYFVKVRAHARTRVFMGKTMRTTCVCDSFTKVVS